MTKTITCVGTAALVACVSLVLSSCDGSSSTTQMSLNPLGSVLIVNQENTALSDSELRMTSIETRVSNTSSTTETGTVNFKMDSTAGEWTANNVAYTYQASTGAITIKAGTVTLSSTGFSVNYSDIVLRISLDMDISDVLGGNTSSDQYYAYQSGTAIVVSGDFLGDGEEDDATVRIVGQSVLITKQ